MAYWEPASLLAVAICFMNITTILIALRYVSMRLAKKSIRMHDIALAASWLFNTAVDINVITAVAYQILGRELLLPEDSDEVDDGAPLTQLHKFYYAYDIMIPLQLAFAKLSIIIFYRRTLVVDTRGFTHWATAACIVLVSLWGMAFFFAALFQCGTHFWLIWGASDDLMEELCTSRYRDLAFAATNLVLDVIVMVLPLHRILTLRLAFTKRLQVAGAFMIGALSVVGAAVRLAVYASAAINVENIFTTSSPSIMTSIVMFWGTFEAGFAVATACLPGLQPLFRRIAETFSQTWSTWSTTRGSSIDSECIEWEKPGPIVVQKEYEVRVSSLR